MPGFALSRTIAIYSPNGRKMMLRESQDIFRISMHTKLRRKWEKSSNCDFCWMPSVRLSGAVINVNFSKLGVAFVLFVSSGGQAFWLFYMSILDSVKLRRKWGKSSNCDFCWMLSVGGHKC